MPAMRDRAVAFLPAMAALLMLVGAGQARTPAALAALCSGGSAPLPGNHRRNCDTACHVGCSRRGRGTPGVST